LSFRAGNVTHDLETNVGLSEAKTIRFTTPYSWLHLNDAKGRRTGIPNVTLFESREFEKSENTSDIFRIAVSMPERRSIFTVMKKKKGIERSNVWDPFNIDIRNVMPTRSVNAVSAWQTIHRFYVI